MNKYKILGGLLFASLAVNIFLGSMLIENRMRATEGARDAMERINAMSEPGRTEARGIVGKYRPEIRADMKSLRETRQETFAYLASKDYNRAEGESRFKAVRDQTAKIQELIQTMVLDLADKLTLEQREALLKHPPALKRNQEP